jgi:hypothetical protein
MVTVRCNRKHIFWLLLAWSQVAEPQGKQACFETVCNRIIKFQQAIHNTKCKPSFVHFILYIYALHITLLLQAVHQESSSNILLFTPTTMHILDTHSNVPMSWTAMKQYKDTQCWRNNEVLVHTVSKRAMLPGNVDIPFPAQTCCDPSVCSLQNKNLQLHLSFHHYNHLLKTATTLCLKLLKKKSGSWDSSVSLVTTLQAGWSGVHTQSQQEFQLFSKMSRLDVRSPQVRIQWIPQIILRGLKWPGFQVSTHLQLMLRLGMSGAIHTLCLCACLFCRIVC